MAGKKKIYPWIKSVFGKKKNSPAECVYAGPSMTEKPEPRVESDGGIAEEVYAGPEFFGYRGEPDGPEEDAPMPEEDEEAGEDAPDGKAEDGGSAKE